MFANLMDVLFGCSHKNYTFPISKRTGQMRSDAASITGTYIVCLDCGKEFPYDWAKMRVIAQPQHAHSAPEPAEAAVDLKAA